MISTKDFCIDELRPSDAASLSHLMVGNTERFQRYFPKTLSQNLNPEASGEFIKRKQEENTSKSEFTWGIRANPNDEVMGLIILKELDWKEKVGEFAYCLDVAFEGRGWMTEIVTRLTKYAIDELGLQTLQIIAHHSNKGSIRIAEKCGFIWQKTLLKSHTPPDGIALDMELYEYTN